MAPWFARTKMRRAQRGGQSNALGRSRGGFSTKLHVVVDTKGRPIYVAITPGQRHEMMKADELLANAPGKAFIADAIS
jgi:IS5 family transposase